MVVAGVDILAVLAAAAAGFLVGMGWYMAFGNAWKLALGKSKAEMKPRATPFIVAALALAVMAFMLAGVILHTGGGGIRGGVSSGAAVWLGFVITTMAVNHAFQGARASLTVIDGGHWLLVLLVMGAVLGAFAV